VTASEGVTLTSVNTKGVEDPSRCQTDSSGFFACLVPTGSTGNLTFTIIFTGFTNKTFDANINAGEATDAGAQNMEGGTTGQWAVIPGAFDGIQVLLAQLKGCTLSDGAGGAFDPATMLPATARASDECTAAGLFVVDDGDVATFLTGGTLSNYQSLFINCAADYSYVDGADAVLQEYNAAGGHIYFSDLADSWLTSAFPGVIIFAGYSTNAGTISASVPYLPLATNVGDPIDIVFDLSAWAAIDDVPATTTTFIQGDISSITSYSGVHPITVGWRPDVSSGCVFYTSYHIEGAGTDTTIPQVAAMKYLVQNISSVCQ